MLKFSTALIGLAGIAVIPSTAFAKVTAEMLPVVELSGESGEALFPGSEDLARFDLSTIASGPTISGSFTDLTAVAPDNSLVGPVHDSPDPGMAEDESPGIGASAARSPMHLPAELSSHRGFFEQAGSIRTELLLTTAYFGAQSGKKLFRPTVGFHFHNEHWFGDGTTNLGIDKMTHAYDTYLLAEILHYRLHRNTNASHGDALTASLLASMFMALNEVSDGIEADSGYSMQDVAMNTVGATFSYLRNTVPGLKEKLAFKIEIVPNSSIYSYRGQRHYEQQRFMLSLKGAGFQGLRNSPLRFVDLQLGYYATDFRAVDRNAGRIPTQRVFVGLGLNVGELLFGRSNSRFGRAVHSALDYFQIPYTSIRYDQHGRLGE